MVKSLAKRAMTTTGQKACYVVDHLVAALGNEASSPLRRAQILVDIDQNSGTTQVEIMERMNLPKATVNREVDWLFNYGCIRFGESTDDGRTKPITAEGYSKKHLVDALDYFDGSHEKLTNYLETLIKLLKQEKPTLRDAKILTTVSERDGIDKARMIDEIPGGSNSTNNRAVNKLVESGVLQDA